MVRFNEHVRQQFRHFRDREDTFSLGVCNGCQLMALLGWIPSSSSVQETDQPRFVENASGRFESRFSSVAILDSPAVMLKGMSGSVLGVWVAHGEGRAHFPAATVKDKMLAKNLAPLRYVDDGGEITEKYPFNPNGSPDGIAGLCSADGRHLCLMPHPERVFLKWQWPWMPAAWKAETSHGGLMASPWLKIFQNAFAFCSRRQQ